MARYGDANLFDLHPPAVVRSMARLWPFVLSVGFGIVFLALADLAWLTAIETTSPWFTSGTSSQMYTATLTTATIATLILASFAAGRLSTLESRARLEAVQDLDAEPREPEASVELTNEVVVPGERSRDPQGLDHILSEIGRFATGPVVEVQEKPTVRMAPATRADRSPQTVTGDGSRDGNRSRTGLRRARRTVWQTVAGPLILFLAFIAISGAMLPAVGGFADSHFQLNTGLILFLGYGWPFLVAWTLAAIAVLNITTRLETPGPMARLSLTRLRRTG